MVMFWVKTYGASIADQCFFRYPRIIERAKRTVRDDQVVGYLLCALDRPPRMTGLLFCSHMCRFPEGVPIHTPPVLDRYRQDGFEVVVAEGGGKYVIAHWLYENGAVDRFDRVH
ncbi:hypothetical protein D3C79_931780 [compost metagenome]